MDHTVIFLWVLLSATAYTTTGTYASLRLVNGRHRCEGRVEVFSGRSWGTVCDDMWDISNARVVCRELKCGEAISAPGNAHFDQGSGPIFLDDVVCTGNEFRLDQCTHRRWGLNDCSHSEDAGVICSGLGAVTEIPSIAEVYTCGQTFSDASRSFIGPYYDGGRNVIECLWTIQSNDYLPIKITLDYVDLDCDHEYINIYNGEVHRSTLLGKICNGSSWTFVSFSGTMSVLLHRASYYTGPGFFAYYDIGELESTTPLELTELPVMVTESTFPALHSETSSAPTTLETSSASTGPPTTLEISSASTTPSTTLEPVSETMTPSTTPEPVSETMTSSPSQNNITTPANPEENTTEGFHCGGILTAPSGYIYGPYYPGNGVSMECIWEIQTASYDHIVLDFYYVSYNLNCSTDYIVIYDGVLGSRKLGRICSDSHYVYNSTSSRITIVLYRNSYRAGDAFSAYYYSSPAVSTLPPATTEPATPVPTTIEYTSGSGIGNITVPPAANQCGGNISLPSGFISGPYYPGDNISVQCVWEIVVSPLDHIILKFSDISLDCNKEYIEIFDGHLYSSYLLGRICSGIYLNYTYISTSNTITILLYRDSNLSGYGFEAYYYSVQDMSPSSAPPHNATAVPATTSTPVSSRSLSCSGEYMVARIRRTYLRSLGYDAWEVYLNSSDLLCRPQITVDYVIFNIPFSGCGTVRQETNNETIVYSNIIKTLATGYIITRKRNFQFHIMCEMNENTIVETMFVAKNTADITEIESGHYDMSLAFYESSSFTYEVHSSPYYVSMNQDLFLQAILNSSDPNLMVFVDTCKASPYAHDFKTLTYDLISSGCVRDPTYRSLYSPQKNAVRFKFNAFKFLNQHNEVYLQCKLVVCMANDYSSRCYQGCTSRKKRDVDEDQDKVEVIVGPLKLQKKANEDKRKELVESVNPVKDEAVSPLTVATVLLAAMVFVLSGFLLSSKLTKRNYHQIY